jgi:hypothetical protein
MRHGGWNRMRLTWRHLTPFQRRLAVGGLASSFGVLLLGLLVVRACRPATTVPPAGPATPASPTPVFTLRPQPASFPPNTHLPNRREGVVSGSIDLGTFSAGRDLVHVDDPRVWWESDVDNDDVEDDHSMHAAMEAPFRRLVELVCEAGGNLKVHDAYRAAGIHNRRSLHREGRAIDVTCDEIGLEALAKLCWSAGFDWVYHESRRGKGAHVHCSVRRVPHDAVTDGIPRKAYSAAP